MKRLSAIFAAALLAVTLSLPVFAEPDQSSTQTSAESSAAAPAGNDGPLATARGAQAHTGRMELTGG